MGDWLIANFISVIAAIASSFAVYYSRRNLKTQKYIETITSQRINWIETLRGDLSDVISGIYMFEYCDQSFRDIFSFLQNGENNNQDELQIKLLQNINTDKLKNRLETELTRVELIKKIDISILRLNLKDDSLLIEKLDTAKNNILQENYNDIIKEGFIQELRNLISETLKKEWDKVKYEVRKR